MENQNNVVNETVEVKTEGGAVEIDTVEVKEEKTFTQAELEKILNKKFAQWQKKTEEAKIEAERKAKLTEAEKLAEERKEFESMKRQFEYEQRVNSTSKVLSSNNLTIEFSDFLVADTEEAKAEAERKAKLTEAEKLAEERKEFERMKMQFEYEQRVNSTSKVLASNNLPIEFADFLIGDSDEATTQRVDLFKNAFNEALEKALTERLRGNTPKVGVSSSKEISKKEFRNMSYKEKMDLYNKDKELFNKLSK